MVEAELFEVKNSLYIGNYQHCINEAQKIQTRDEALKVERDVYIYRALIGQRKYGVVQSQIKESAAPQLQALKLLAKFLQNPAIQSSTVEALDALVTATTLEEGGAAVALAAATVRGQQGDWEGALRVLNTRQELECRAHTVHCLLAMNRADAAKKELVKMAEGDGDATLTELATAWMHVATGGDKLQDAYYIYQEMMDKYTPTATLLAGQAACFLGQGRTDEAESALQEALEKDPHCADTLVGLLVWSGRAGAGGEQAARYMQQLRDSHAGHVVVKAMEQRELDFDRVCAMYSPSVV